MKNTQHRIPKECRQQLKAQLYQQRENIQFDPALHALCAQDIKQYCFKVEPGNSQVIFMIIGYLFRKKKFIKQYDKHFN